MAQLKLSDAEGGGGGGGGGVLSDCGSTNHALPTVEPSLHCCSNLIYGLINSFCGRRDKASSASAQRRSGRVGGKNCIVFPHVATSYQLERYLHCPAPSAPTPTKPLVCSHLIPLQFSINVPFT